VAWKQNFLPEPGPLFKTITSAMLNTSYTVILSSLLSMIIAGVLLYFDAATILAYVLLVAGFFGVGIGLLIGFFTMVKDQGS
jgi:hypothetical protein